MKKTFKDLHAPPDKKLTPTQKTVIQFINESTCKFNIAASLTFNEKFNSSRKVIENLLIRASKEFSHFDALMNREVYGNNWHRISKKNQKRRIPIIPIIEGVNNAKHLHYHAILGCPDHVPIPEFIRLINKCWSQGYYRGEYYNHAEETYDKKGWTDYIVKEITETNDSIDINNIRIW